MREKFLARSVSRPAGGRLRHEKTCRDSLYSIRRTTENFFTLTGDTLDGGLLFRPALRVYAVDRKRANKIASGLFVVGSVFKAKKGRSFSYSIIISRTMITIV